MKALSILFVGLVNFQVAASSMLALDDGAIEYEVKEGGDTVVLFDAGALSGMAGWDSIWERLPADITAIRFSRLGEGNSEPCSGQRSAADYVDEVDQLLNALQVEQPIVYVGHSLGGTTARNFAATHQGDVAAMLMIDPENPRDVDIVYQLNPEEGRAEIEMVKQNDYAAGDGKWCFLDMMWDKSPAAGLAEIGDLAVTLIAGVKVPEDPSNIFESAEGRRLWGEIQSQWVNQFPQGEAVLTRQSGHFVQNDEPELVVSELVKLLNNVRL